MKHGIGDKLVITNCFCGHRFSIGETVVVRIVTDVDYQVENAYGEKWWVRDDEVDVEKWFY